MTRLLATLMVLSVCGCKEGAAPPALSDMTAFRSGIQVSDSFNGLTLGIAPDHFAFGELRDIWIRVAVPALPSTAVETLELINPKGEIQYAERLPYSLDSSKNQLMMGNMPNPVDVMPATAVPGGVFLDRSLLVAATNFYRYPYEGDWTVRASVEGVPGTFTTPIRVTLK